MVINLSPQSQAEDVDPVSQVSFGVRSASSRIIRDTLSTDILFGRITYIGDERVDYDPAFRAGEGRATLAAFSDAVVTGVPGLPALQTLVSGGLLLSKTSSLRQESFIFATDRVVLGGPCGVTVDFSNPAWSRGATDYFSNPDFASIVIGMTHWKYKTGIFAMLMDDGVGNYYVDLTGPAIGATGTRYAIVSGLPIDWTSGDWSFRFVWDDTPGQESVSFVASSASGDVTYLLDRAATLLLRQQPFNAGLTLGQDKTSVSASRIGAIVGVDGNPSDQLEIARISIAGFGVRPVVSGVAQTGVASAIVAPNAAVPLRADSVLWPVVGTGTLSQQSGSLILDVASAEGPAYFQRDEPDLDRGSWMIIASLFAKTGVVSGSVKSGIALQINDGNESFELGLLVNSGTRALGIRTSATSDNLADYSIGTEVDWQVSQSVVFVGDQAADRLFVDVGSAPYLDLSYSASSLGPSVTTDVSIGTAHLVPWASTSIIGSLWIIPTAICAEPILGSLPTSQGWSSVSSGGSASIVNDLLEVDCTQATQQYLAYYFAPPSNEVEDTAGGVILLCGAIPFWSNLYGSRSPTNSEIGPVACVRIGDYAAALSFTRGGDGRSFAFFRSEAVTLRDVLNQTITGKTYSTQVDFTQVHTYLIDVRVGEYVRLYIDYAEAPAINIPWEKFDLVVAPAILPSSAFLAFGSLDPSGPIQGSFRFARAGRGRGYDVRTSLQLAEDVLVEWAYNSTATLLVDVEDA